MNVIKEIKNLQKQMSRVISNMAKDKKYTGYDIEAGRTNTAKAQHSADDANSLAGENEIGLMDVAEVASENDEAVMDIAEVASENDTAIMDIAEVVASLEERVEKLERKEGEI